MESQLSEYLKLAKGEIDMRWIIPLAIMVLGSMWVTIPAAAQDPMWVKSSVQDGTPENTEAFNKLKGYFVSVGEANNRDVSIMALTEAAIEHVYQSRQVSVVPRMEHLDAFKERLAVVFADKNGLDVRDGRVTWGNFVAVGAQNNRRGQPGFAPLSPADVINAINYTASLPTQETALSEDDKSKEVLSETVSSQGEASVVEVGEETLPPEQLGEELAGSETVVETVVSDDRIRGLEARLEALEGNFEVTSSRADSAFQLTGQIESTAEDILELQRLVSTQSVLVEERFIAIEGSIAGLEETARAHQTAIKNIRTQNAEINTLATEAKALSEATAADLVESKTATALQISGVEKKTWWESWMFIIVGFVLIGLVIFAIFAWIGRSSTVVKEGGQLVT